MSTTSSGPLIVDPVGLSSATSSQRPAISFGRVLVAAVLLRGLVALVLAGWELATPTPPMADSGYYQQMEPCTSLWGQMFLKWDSYWYLQIAEHGYSLPLAVHGQSPTAFAPLYPYMLRVLGAVGIMPWIGGVILSTSCFLLTLWFLYRLGTRVACARVACALVLFYALFPSAWVLNMVYTEALFCLILAALLTWHVEGRYVLAGVCAALLPLTRTAGVVLVPVLAADWVCRSWRERRLAEGGITVVGAIAGVAGLFTFFAMATGDAGAFLDAGKAWFERAGVAGHAFPLLHSIPLRLQDDAFAPLFVACILFYGIAAIVLLVRRRDVFGWFSVAYMAMLLQTPILNAQMRYLLPLIPVHLMVASVMISRPIVFRVTVVLLLLTQIMITRGYLVWTIII